LGAAPTSGYSPSHYERTNAISLLGVMDNRSMVYSLKQQVPEANCVINSGHNVTNNATSQMTAIGCKPPE
jgi:hypothetical protein